MNRQDSEPEEELRALLAAAPLPPAPSPELDRRIRALLSSSATPWWKRVLLGGVRIPVPVLAALVALLVWALARRAPPPESPPFRVTPVEARHGYVAVTAPRVTISGRPAGEQGGAR